MEFPCEQTTKITEFTEHWLINVLIYFEGDVSLPFFVVQILQKQEYKMEDRKMASIEILENQDMQEVEFTEEENKEIIRANEDDFIQGLIDAASFTEDDTQKIEIKREGKLYFAFTIHPLTEEQYNKCRKKHTKYVRNRQMGTKVPEETDAVKYRAALIYEATITEDREKLWDNKKVWEALRNKDKQILNGLDVIEYTLRAGEKDKIIDCIDSLSGYEDNLEEVAKN